MNATEENENLVDNRDGGDTGEVQTGFSIASSKDLRVLMGSELDFEGYQWE